MALAAVRVMDPIALYRAERAKRGAVPLADPGGSRDALVARLARSGLSAWEIAERAECSRSTVWRVLRRGKPTRTKGGCAICGSAIAPGFRSRYCSGACTTFASRKRKEDRIRAKYRGAYAREIAKLKREIAVLRSRTENASYTEVITPR